MSRKQNILVVDDEAFVRDSLSDLLENEGYAVATASSATEALETLRRRSIDAVVADLSMPGGDGLGLLADLRALGMTTPLILLTGVGTVSDAVAAMKAGAYDFVQKPVDPDQFVLLVSRAIEHRALADEVEQLRHTLRDLRGSAEMVGTSAPFQRLRSLIEQVAPTDATVLVTGESGTGKELIAHEIHRLSDRASRQIVCVNCSAVSESLFESEFFGHRRGSFTGAVDDRAGRFEEAEGGTLVLDEVSTLPAAMQAKLLRVLESGEYARVGDSRTRIADVRIVAISNEDMPALVKAGNFRSDLYYRLNVFPIDVPPLRDRKDDIPLLADHFLRGAARRAGTDAALSQEALEVLTAYGWPGNIRELRNVIERAAILSGSTSPDAELFHGIVGAAIEATPSPGEGDLNLRRRLSELERQLVLEAISRTREKKEAAAALGIDPKNLAYYIKKHGLERSGSGRGP